jgi:hypothetical protein
MKGKRQNTASTNEDKLRDANQKLRAENKRLRKQLAQAQKQKNKPYTEQDQWEVYEEEIVEEEPTPQISDKCPKCKEPIKVINLGMFILRLCESCGWKKRKRVD